MSHTKAGGSTRNGRDSAGRRLGVKLFGGQVTKTGDIIIRQRGTKYMAGENTFVGSDFTIHAATEGTITFKQIRRRRFTGAPDRKTVVSVTPTAVA
ncbi:MAG: 50S ribosomal protein L27 [bacterium]